MSETPAQPSNVGSVTGSSRDNRGMADVLKGGVTMDAITPDQAHINKATSETAVVVVSGETSDGSRCPSLPWKTFFRGQTVSIIENGRPLGMGTIDATTADGTLLWIQLHGVEGRRLFHKDDQVHIQLSSHDSETTIDSPRIM
ncbi:hypothetical protein [Arthrobacter sp. USHLN218]|uniref:hypothetical protein n=1 Tax=Arthrobacter sp. USHLN218 TaxID=3081232 RepID=UPI003FA60BAD